jgi:hypothetical protein
VKEKWRKLFGNNKKKKKEEEEEESLWHFFWKNNKNWLMWYKCEMSSEFFVREKWRKLFDNVKKWVWFFFLGGRKKKEKKRVGCQMGFAGPFQNYSWQTWGGWTSWARNRESYLMGTNQKAIYRPLLGPLIISNKKAKTRQEFP